MGRIDDVATCGNILRIGIDGKCGSVSGRPKQSPMLGKSEYSGAGIGTKLADGVFALIRKTARRSSRNASSWRGMPQGTPSTMI